MGVYCPYDTHSVNLKLHDEILVPEGGKFSVNLINSGSLAELIKQHSKVYKLNKKQPYELEPGEFVLGRTLEWIELPMTDNQPYLAARIEGKSSRARWGLLVHCTAPTVHPDFKGILTLELVNLGPATMTLFPEMDIAQLIVEQVDGEILRNPSSFQEQSDASGAKLSTKT